MKQKVRNSLYVLSSLFFALLLFFSAHSISYNRTDTQLSQEVETYTHTLEKLPIEFRYDTEKYFISDYSTEVTARLSSTNRVKLNQEITEATRQFKVVADLDNLDEGTHVVTLRVKNLPKEVTVQLDIDKIKVTIGKKVNKNFKVQTDIPNEQVAESYYVKSAQLDVEEVQVTSDAATIAKIDRIVAKLPNDIRLADNYSESVNLQALSRDGQILASIIKPAKAKLTVTLDRFSKKVPIRIVEVGQLADGISAIKTDLSQKEVTVYGSKEELDGISEVVTQLDISQITSDTSKDLTLAVDNVTLDTKTITAKITVSKE